MLDKVQEELENARDTFQRVEKILHRGLGIHSSGVDSATDGPPTPDAFIASDRMFRVTPPRFADFHDTVSSYDDLPLLLPNTEVDGLPLESSLKSAATTTTIGEFFDYALYAADQPDPVGLTQNQENQRQGDREGNKQDRSNIARERASEKDVLLEEEVTTPDTSDVQNQEVDDIHYRAGNETQQALVKETCPNDGSQSPTSINIVADAVVATSDSVLVVSAPYSRGNSFLGV